MLNPDRDVDVFGTFLPILEIDTRPDGKWDVFSLGDGTLNISGSNETLSDEETIEVVSKWLRDNGYTEFKNS